MKYLYLMRHGETLFNVEHKNQGWCDSPLTEKGIKQAQIAGEYFRKNNIVFDHCYASTSERACDTLELVTDNKYPYTRLKGLKEYNFGTYEGQDNYLNPVPPFGEFFASHGGETDMLVRERMVKTLSEIMAKDDHEVVLAVSHGAACAQFIRANEATNVVQMQKGIKNCAIFKYEYHDGIFSCVEIINHDFSALE